MSELLLREARLPGATQVVDVAIAEGAVTEVSPAGSVAGLGREEVNLAGRWLIPGLWDAHVHFAQWARTRGRLNVAHAESAAEVCAVMAGVDGEQLAVGFGFRWATWTVPPTLEQLDRARPAPTVVLSGDLHTAWVNTAAARLLGIPRPGVLVEDAAFAAEIALDSGPVPMTALAEAVAAAHARGVVGVVDLELADNVQAWRERAADGLDSLRVQAGFYPELLDARVDARARSGSVVEGTRGMVTHGPLKIITDGSLNSLTAHCLDAYQDGSHGLQNVAPEELVRLMARAHAAGISCAIHAIGDAANRIALDAFESTGARGTIEHAQLLALQDIPRFAALGVTASVQPEHAVDDRDATDRIWPDRADRAYALRALLDSGARLSLGSDAPVAPLDPWRAIAAAVTRTGDARPAWHAEQALTVEEALAASTRHGVEAGAPADLAVLDLNPLTAPAPMLRSMPVALTLVGGRAVHSSL